MNDNDMLTPDHDDLCNEFVVKTVKFIMAEKDGNVAITLMAYILGNVAAKSTDPERVIEGTVTVSKLVLASIEGDAT